MDGELIKRRNMRVHGTLGIAVIVVLIVVVTLLGRMIVLQTNLTTAQSELTKYQTNEKIAGFAEEFVDTVLRGGGEIDFEMRLDLENAVRDIGDKEILDTWKAFTQSPNEGAAQDNVVDLLEILIRKMQI